MAFFLLLLLVRSLALQFLLMLASSCWLEAHPHYLTSYLSLYMMTSLWCLFCTWGAPSCPRTFSCTWWWVCRCPWRWCRWCAAHKYVGWCLVQCLSTVVSNSGSSSNWVFSISITSFSNSSASSLSCSIFLRESIFQTLILLRACFPIFLVSSVFPDFLSFLGLSSSIYLLSLYFLFIPALHSCLYSTDTYINLDFIETFLFRQLFVNLAYFITLKWNLAHLTA